MDLVARHDHAATMTGAGQRVPPRIGAATRMDLDATTIVDDQPDRRNVTDSMLVHHKHAATTIADVHRGHRGHRAMVSTPGRHKPGVTTTDRRSSDHRAMGNQVARSDHRAPDQTRRTPVVRSGAMTTSVGHAPARLLAVRPRLATIAPAIGDVAQLVRSDVTTTGDRRVRARLPEISVGTDRPLHHAADRVRVLAGRGVAPVGVRADRRADLPVVQAVRSVDQMLDRAALDVGLTQGRVARDAARMEVRVGRASARAAILRQVGQGVVVNNRRMTIAIDGPAAAGKSTVGEIVAQRIDGVYFDTGLLYRALTLLALEYGIDPSDAVALAKLAASMDIQLGRPTVADGRQVDVLLSGRDVSGSLRTPSIDRNVSAISAHAPVRLALLDQQRRIGRSGRVVMVGRDIGTVVLPDAELKVFLDASPEERARRRCQQLDEMGQPQSYEAVLADMRCRDRIDSERDVAPLKPADDALVIDSDALTIAEVAEVIVQHAQQRLAVARG